MDNQTTEPQVQSDTTQAVSDQSQQTQPTTLGTPVVAEQPKEDTVDFKSLIPESFKDEKSLENFNNMEDLLKSYLHAQKMVGADKIPVPNKFATDFEIQIFYFEKIKNRIQNFIFEFHFFLNNFSK